MQAWDGNLHCVILALKLVKVNICHRFLEGPVSRLSARFRQHDLKLLSGSALVFISIFYDLL
jgi:hypothetical protein